MAEPARPLLKKPEKSLPTLATELWQLVLAYLKQETLEPLKGLLRFVGIGIGGAVLTSLGLVLLAVAGLRALQVETAPHFAGNLSWLPYLIVLVGAVLIAALSAKRISAKRRTGSR